MKNTYFLCIAKRYDAFDISQYICSIYVHHPWKKDKKKNIHQRRLKWDLDQRPSQQRPKGHSNPRKMSIYHISKGQLISKAIHGLLTSPKKRTDEFVLFAFLLFMANKSNSSVRFLGESTAGQSAFWFFLTFSSTHIK